MRRKISVIIIGLTILLGCGGGDESADLLIVGGVVYTLDPDQLEVEAVAVRGDVIVFAGERKRAAKYQGPRTLVLDVSEHAVLPGLVDAHAHLMNLGRYLANLQLVGTASVDTIRQLVIDRQRGVDADEWIVGRGWDQNDWDVKEFPTWNDLTGTEANPVFLRRVGGHASWLNSTAMERLGITRDTPDPFGGRYLRDDEGNLTGVLIDRAKDLAWEEVPEPSLEEKTRRIEAAIAECQRFGLTGMHEAQTTRDVFEILQQMTNDDQLRFRVYAILDTDDSTFVMERFASGPLQTPYLTARAIKVYADGALGSRGAALLAPYSDDATHRGLMRTSPEVIRNWTRLAVENGFQMCAHAIGDAGNRVVIDIYERESGADPGGERRFRIEHAQLLAPGDIARIADLGIIASMQPTHATSDMYWAEDRVGQERIEGAYAWRRLMAAGALIACGSDFPVEAVNPLWGIYAAVTRQDHDGWPAGGWRADERMTMEEALSGFTANAAYAAFAERQTGTIERGKFADLTIVDRDIFRIPPAQILATRTVYTIVGGQIVYAARDSAETQIEDE